jgi:diacylglycerol kinase (ATP)
MPRGRNGIRSAIIIYNPASGVHSAGREQEVQEAIRILSGAGIETQFAVTSASGSATIIARDAASRGCDLVIVCGGDGTINEAANGLIGYHSALGLLPAGSANILAKELGIPWDIRTAARLIPHSTPRRIALGLARSLAPGSSATERYFVCVGGAGPDGELVKMVESAGKNHSGTRAYWLAGLRAIFRYKFPLFQVASGQMQVDASLLVVGRTGHYGGPFRITTEASLFEDSFELMACTSQSALRYAASLPALWLGRLRGKPGFHYWKTPAVRCASTNGAVVNAQVDGEYFGALPVEFTIVPDALSLLVPAGVPPPR